MGLSDASVVTRLSLLRCSTQTLVDKYAGYLQDVLPVQALQQSVRSLAKDLQASPGTPLATAQQDGARIQVSGTGAGSSFKHVSA